MRAIRTTRGARGGPETAGSARLLSGFVLALFAVALAAAPPAQAVEDARRATARVTHGPSCRAGGLVVEVVAGTSPYFVRLATTRQPAEEDEVTLLPGTTAVLRTGDVDWGETIDGRLEFSARDGSGVTSVDELEEYSSTRPTWEDCQAIGSPPPAEQPPTDAPAPAGGSGAPGALSPPPATVADRSDARPVAPGDRVTLRAPGFLPGERVTIQLHDSRNVLRSATAGPDGTVEAVVRIPARTAEGSATVDLVGGESEFVADVDLQVAALETAVDRDRAVSLLSGRSRGGAGHDCRGPRLGGRPPARRRPTDRERLSAGS